MLSLSFTGLSTLHGADPAESGRRQVYPLDAGKVRINAELVAGDLKNIPEKDQHMPAVWYIIPALSSIKRLPDAYPEDGEVLGDLTFIAARGEYEPASFVLYPQQDVDRLTFTVSDLVHEKSAEKIPADCLDLKLVKIWYQQGTAWYSYFGDNFGRVLCPELLVNDENLIYVDPETRDNYVRYSNADGSESYVWNSASFMLTDYKRDAQVCTAMVQDAPQLQSVVLNRNEWKQFMCTLHVPQDAGEGLYHGTIRIQADGIPAGEIPVLVRVLPFSLPVPKTNYDLDKEFYLTFYGAGTGNPKVLKNLAAHNMRQPLWFPLIDPLNPDRMQQYADAGRKAGLPLKPAFAAGPGAGIEKDLEDYEARVRK